MTGKELEIIIKDSDLPVIDIIKKSGIKERTFHSLKGKDRVPLKYLKKLKIAGVNIPKLELNSLSSEQLQEKEKGNDKRDLTFDILLRLIDTQKEHIDELRLNYKRLEERLAELEYQQSFYDRNVQPVRKTKNTGKHH